MTPGGPGRPGAPTRPEGPGSPCIEKKTTTTHLCLHADKKYITLTGNPGGPSRPFSPSFPCDSMYKQSHEGGK